MKTRAIAAVAAVLAIAPSARADAVDACVEGADHAQQKRDQGKLLEAREQLIACASSSCPTLVSKQCAKWLVEIDEQIPSVTLRVRSSSGADVADAIVTLDGTAHSGALAGRPITLDPGPHHFTFKRGDETAEANLVVRASEKNRLVDVTLVAPQSAAHVVIAPPPPPPIVEERAGFRFPWTAGVFLGVAAGSFVATGALVAIASSDAGTMRSTCAPTCPAGEVDSAHTKLVVANVTLGLGIASVALAAIFLIVANVGHHDKRAAAIPMSIRF